MTQAPSGTGRRTGTLVVGGVAVVILIMGVLASSVLLYRQSHLTDAPFSFSNSGSPVPSQSQQAHVKAAAEQFALQMDAVNGKDPAAYVNGVSKLVTTKLRTSLKTQYAQFQKLGIEPTQKGTGTILSSAVADMDDDSATVLIAHDSSVVSPQGTTLSHYRWTVSLRKVGSKWLVDNFTQVS
ncbi:MAG: hypothetical protein JWP74_171 [Marmoricola sp.]|nr:hypothetical protein [Marmoricola sp.]